MNNKVFEYFRKDIPFIKKDCLFRLIFSGLYLLIFVWQIITLIVNLAKKSYNIGMLISSVVVLVLCLLFIAISLMYSLKNIRIISVIKTRGKCTSSVFMLHNLKKDSYIKLYSVVTQILAVVISLVLICCITYSILEISYYSTISFYMPLLFVTCLTGYYSMIHIQNEIKLAQTVQEYHRA